MKSITIVARPKLVALVACIAVVLLSGCSHTAQSSTGDASTNALPVPAPTAAGEGSGTPHLGQPAAAPASSFSSIPGHIDIGTGASLTPTPDLDAKIAKLQKGGGSKKELSFLYTQRAIRRMMDAQASPHVKYPAALEDFRTAVKLDPTNKEAVNNKNLIESIYRSMGRPIPST